MRCPPTIRADFYREMRHCRSLPENDEMLRILRIMQFLTLLMEQVPARIGVERERYEQLIGWRQRACRSPSNRRKRTGTISISDSADCRTRLQRESARRLSPGKINESLRQQFIQTTIPQTAEALAVVSTELRQSSSEFSTTAASLGKRYSGAVHEAREAIDAIQKSTEIALSAARRLVTTYQEEYRWSILLLTGCSLVTGTLLGTILDHWAFR